jgi:ribosomal protein S18 acetylase RimI-like enzyme
MHSFAIVESHTGASADVEQLEALLDEHNMEVTELRAFSSMAFLVRDELGALGGGILGDIWGSWLHIRTLWLRPDARGRGLSVELLRRAELHGIERGCDSVHLSTFNFQAPELYLKCGYVVFGTLEHYPPGHTQFFLKKRLR